MLERGDRFDFVLLDLLLGSEDGLEVPPLIARFNSTAVLVLFSGFDGRILAASERLATGFGLLVARRLPSAARAIFATKSKRSKAGRRSIRR